ncbi:tetratricopeptide repeat protein [Actinoplanes sp. GCM10030250]|uniref:tetratricopeptide repeat protein n=1 Tax=Actinoplanes sp. GCM10030250 TaxID=3273376 RepID=UPI003606E5A9
MFSRVVEVRRPADRGSGYAVASDLVLTAAHVVGEDTEVEVTPHDRGTDSVTATVVWRHDTLDAALIRLPAPLWDTAEPPALWGELSGIRAVRCVATGYPDAQISPGGLCVEESISGFIMPGTGRRSARYGINVTSALPKEPDSRTSLWAGMSGAAVLTEDGRYLLGVLIEDPASFEPSRLEAVPVAYLLREPAFRELLDAGPGTITVLPEHEFLRPMSQLPPSTMTDIHLLMPKFGIVPYVERAAPDAALLDWASGADPLDVALVVGAGGTGKTRLAIELCERLRRDQWDVGRVDDPRGVAVDRLRARTLLVVDYAEHQDLDALQDLIVRLSERPGGDPVRLLLLARHAGSWWDWVHPAVIAGTRRGDALVLELESHAFSPAERSAHVTAAATAFAQRLGRPVPDPVGVDSDEYDNVLLVQVAALLAVRGEAVGDAMPGQLQAQLLTVLLKREKDSWYRGFPGGVTPRLTRLPERAVLIALLAAPDRERSRELLRLLDAFADAGNERLEAVAAWLDGVFAGDGRLESIGPDLVASAFLAGFPDLGEIAQVVLDRAGLDADRQAHLLNTVRLAAEHHAACRTALVQILAAGLTRMVGAALDLDDHQLIGALNAAVVLCTAHREGLPRLARAAAAALDEVDDSHPTLGALGVTLSDLVVRGYRALTRTSGEPDNPAFRLAFAQALLKLSTSLSVTGESEQAVRESEQAVAILRDLAAREPGLAPSLATGLGNLGACLARSKQLPAAVLAAEEAVSIRRSAAVTDRRRLGAAVNNLGGCYFAMQRYAEALTALTEAAELLGAAPGGDGDELAGCLHNLAHCHLRLDDERSAARVADRALTLVRSLMATNPHRYAPDLIDALILTSRVRRRGSLAAAEEAVRLSTELAARGTSVHRKLLARALTALATAQTLAGCRPQAIQSYRQAIAVHRQITDDDRNHPPDDLAQGLMLLTLLLLDAKQPRQALEAGRESVSLLEAAAGSSGSDAHTYVTAQTRVGEILLELGEPRTAIEHFSKAITTLRRLGTTGPEDTRAELAVCLHLLGNSWSRLGNPEEAAPVLGEAVSIYEALLAAGERRCLRRLAAVQHSLGSCWLRTTRWADGVGPTEEALRLYRLADAAGNPDHAAVADCLTNLSGCYLQLDRTVEAIEAAEEAVTVYRRLVKTDPVGHRKTFANALVVLSSCYLAAERRPDSLRVAVEAVQAARRTPEPDNRWARETLAAALVALGRVRAVMGLAEPALDAVTEATDLMMLLADDAPVTLISGWIETVKLQSELYRNAGNPEKALDAILTLAQRMSPTMRRSQPALSELVGDRYADLTMPEQSAAWWRLAVQGHVMVSQVHPDWDGGGDLRRLADKLESAGKSGAATAARRLADAQPSPD